MTAYRRLSSEGVTVIMWGFLSNACVADTSYSISSG